MMKKKNQLREWKQLSAEALTKTAVDLAEKQRSLRFLASQGKLKNVRELREVRKNIARLKTLISSPFHG